MSWWGNGFFLEKKMLKLIFKYFEIFTFFIFHIYVSVSLRIFNSRTWNWSQMFTFGLYYPSPAITPYRRNGPFTCEMPQIKKQRKNFTRFSPVVLKVCRNIAPIIFEIPVAFTIIFSKKLKNRYLLKYFC